MTTENTDKPTKATCPVCQTEQGVKQDGGLRKHKEPGGVLPCTGSGQPVGPARIPRRSKAGFYKCHTTGAMLRSVTTVLNLGSPKESLIHWAGNLVAETAMAYLPRLVRASLHPATRKEVYDWLRRAHTRKRDERGDLGSAVHLIIESKILDQPIPAEIIEDPEMAPYIEHFEAFVREWQVTFKASEMVVANYDDEYAGTLDFTLDSPLFAEALGCPPDTDVMGDTKTGGELDELTYDGGIKGVYPEAGVQMSAYRRAPYGWLRDGTRVPRPLCHDTGVVLHLRPEGYRLYPVRCGDDVYAAFLNIRKVADFQTGLAKNVVGKALTPPKIRKVA
ncbi:hypothetical protein ACRYCC_25995 [Actinomadura scrupuli]|uniref:hypothetical protein n=1 Tax=Actinomadura scrupuli TaxID=559629 RepID=UPI003D96EE89